MVDNNEFNAEFEHEEEFDPEELDFTLEGEEEANPDDEEDEEVKKKKAAEEEAPDFSSAELAKVRADYEALKADKERLEEEREQAAIKAEEANRITVQTAITQRQSDVKREKDARRNLMVDFEEAKANQDIEKIKALTRAIGEKDDLIELAQNDISQWQPLLNNRVTPRVETKAAPKQEQWQILAQQWKSENGWIDDPKFKDKKQKALALYEQLQKDGYDHNKIGFWTHINTELKEFDKPKEEVKRRTPPAVRSVKTQGATQVSNKKKADAEILTAAHKALERRGITKGNPDFDRLEKSYYRTYQKHAHMTESNG